LGVIARGTVEVSIGHVGRADVAKEVKELPRLIVVVSTPQVFGEPSVSGLKEHNARGICPALAEKDGDIASSDPFPFSFVGAGTPRGYAPSSDCVSLGH
jgi:hypothetical protein